MLPTVDLGSKLIPIGISVIVIFIMLFSLLVTIKYSSSELYKKTRLNVFFSTLASVAIIVVGINLMISSIAFESDQQFSRHAKTKEAIDKLWIYPNQMVQSATHVRPEFMASFFMNNPKLYKLTAQSKPTPITLAGIIQEHFITDIMIEAWEDCLSIRTYDLTPMKLWVRSFLSWAQSPYFKFYYDQNIYGYMDSTKQFGELLFEYAKKLPIPVEDINLYNIAADELMKDPRYLSLMKQID